MYFYKALLLLLMLSSCGGGSSSSDDETNSPIIQPPNLSNETCENTQVQNLKRCDLIHNSIERFYYIYEPSNIDSNSES